MSKFNTGDVIRVESQQDPGTYNIGVIDKAYVLTVQGFISEEWYDVTWAQTGLKGIYRALDVDHLWNQNPVSGTLQEAAKQMINDMRKLRGSPWFDVNISMPTPTVKKECQHNWKVYDSGFSYYEYCEHCDIKKAQ